MVQVRGCYSSGNADVGYRAGRGGSVVRNSSGDGDAEGGAATTAGGRVCMEEVTVDGTVMLCDFAAGPGYPSQNEE